MTNETGTSETDPKPKVHLDIVSDVMCPWCYIGKRRLEAALEQVKDTDVTVTWRPYQLDPTLPPEGRDRREYLETKFGGPERAKEIYSRIEDAGREENLAFDFKSIAVSPNTLDAHRVIRWSINEGQEVQDKLVERLFELFFTEGVNIGQHDVLIKAADEAGMDAAVVAALLATDQDKDAVSQEIATAQQMGVTGVPCFIIDNKYAVMGAQSPEHIAAAIQQAAAQGADTENGSPG
ncbi:MAG: DsbA family oxidoreductase [Pseudomonadota bacterium]